MANPFKGEALVRVEGGEFTLAMTLGACASIEGHFDNRPLNEILSELDGDNPRLSVLLVVVWAGLKKHHNLTIDEVGDIVSMADATIWSQGLIVALGRAQPEAQGKARPPKAKAG